MNKIDIAINTLFSQKKNNKIDFDSVFVIDDNPDFIFGSSDVKKVHFKNRFLYFRECKDVSKNFKDYCIYYIDKLIYQYKGIHVFALIKNDLKKDKNLKKISRTLDTYTKHYNSILKRIFFDFSLVGLPSLNAFSFGKNNTEILQIIKSVVLFYKKNKFSKFKAYGTLSLNRIFSYSIFLDELGLSECTPKVFAGTLKCKGYIEKGIFMEEAAGVNAALLQLSERKTIENNFLNKLSSIEIVDFLCYEIDHRIDNYNVKISNNIIQYPVFFDNDESFSFSPIFSVRKQNYSSCFPIIKNNKFSRPYIDYSLFKSLSNLDWKSLNNKLKNYLNPIQLVALRYRVCMLLKSFKNDKSFLTKLVHDWSAIDASAYMNDQYIKNYIYNFFTDDFLLNRIKKYGM